MAGSQQAEWQARVQTASSTVKAARLLDADWPVGTLEEADAALDAALAGAALPPFVLPIANGAVYGKTKWLPGSLGCDLFMKRGMPVVAPADCLVEEVLGGTGQEGGDELILSLPDRSWAWRYRHTRAAVTVGQHVNQGDTVGEVFDPSLDTLPPVPAWDEPMPDGWQHLDLSVNRGSDQFNPQGGSGGNVSAYDWLVALGYHGRLLPRTPGFPDVGLGLVETLNMLTPAAFRPAQSTAVAATYRGAGRNGAARAPRAGTARGRQRTR
jgi:hypothetical protein